MLSNNEQTCANYLIHIKNLKLIKAINRCNAFIYLVRCLKQKMPLEFGRHGPKRRVRWVGGFGLSWRTQTEIQKCVNSFAICVGEQQLLTDRQDELDL